MRRGTMALLSAVGALTLLALPSHATEPRWVQASPFGGNIIAIAQAPSLPTTLYAVAGTGGVFRSVDGGSTWRPRRAPGENSRINKMLVDPNDPQTVYAVSYETLWRTRNGMHSWSVLGAPEDGATTWRPAGSGLPTTRICGYNDSPLPILVQDPGPRGTLYVGTAGKGVFRSDDSGETFHPMDQGLKNATITALVASRRGLFAGAHGLGVYRWNEVLQRWTPLNRGLPVREFTGALAIDPGGPNFLYAGTRIHGAFRLQLTRETKPGDSPSSD